MEQQKTYCHSGSVENYFNSPKMPVMDHLIGLKSTSSSFKAQCKNQKNDQAASKVLGQMKPETLNHLNYLHKIKEMKLLNPKQLSIVSYQSGKENANINSHHDRQTNAGYSRNKLGGFFTS